MGFTATLLASALGGCDAQTPEQPPQHHATVAEANAIAAEAARGCKDDPSERLAQLARNEYPDSLAWPNPPKWRFPDLWGARATFLRKHRWEFFDFDHNGRMSFDEYHAWLWASLLSGATPKKCIVTRDEYLRLAFGNPGEPQTIWSTKMEKTFVDARLVSYNELDQSKKGFITKADTENVDRFSFDRANTMSRGYLEPDQSF